ncbi:aminopeptidase P family protein [Imperialibacter roseus]|uniref:Xaa-Pro aminopeptidase n=1 Tax=Imperialibacter roseus TaxID=1324217 RepID=A0ABZ0ILN6_9BACT|nr:aminopeptidase P family protein [Imperialibacter roseus]WOK05611.1 aminopeptidase P family protein [Imperialibacter roseus]
MRYRPAGKELFTYNREKLQKRLKPNSVAIVRANDIMPTNADGTMGFRQNADLFYLTGIDQEDTIVLLAPDFPDESLREVLFLRETSEEIAIWEGHKFTKEEGREISGITTVKWSHEFHKVLYTILAESTNIYLESNEHIRAASEVTTSNQRFVKWCMEHYPLYNYERLAPILYDLRCIKSEKEIEIIKHACDITANTFRKMLGLIKPGVWEYEVEAEYIYEFILHRSRGFAYTPIIGGGANSCVLHYIENNQQLKSGDVLLMDVGAEYGNYNADLTRTVPVNGKFTKRQRAVYDAVLRVKNDAIDMLTPGGVIPEYHKEVGKIMESELLGLGLLDKTDIKKQNPAWPAYKKYFMHGTSHHLGIDVHDVASIYKVFEPGMVFTVEPGIYIREEGLGIRIEDNIVITKEGHINLLAGAPCHAEEIEDLMNRS